MTPLDAPGRQPSEPLQLGKGRGRFQKIQQFGGISRQAGGVCAVEMALWDSAGKVYNCPVYQMLGGQWRDRIRIYADTTESEDPKEYGRRAKERVAMGKSGRASAPGLFLGPEFYPNKHFGQDEITPSMMSPELTCDKFVISTGA